MVVIAVASDLFAGEARRETLGFLVRMPGGLVLPLLAKVALYFAAVVLALVWGMTILLTAHALYGHTGGFVQNLFDGAHDWHLWTLVSCFGGLWVTLVSCWVPRGGGAVLGGALMLGIVALPLFLLQRMETYFYPLENERIGLAAAASVAALVALFFSFARGRRFGRGVWASAWRGLAVVGVLMMGTTAWGMTVVRDIRTLELGEKGFHIYSARILAGDRWALTMVGQERGPSRIWAVDLQTGAHQELGPGGAMLWSTHADWVPSGLPSTYRKRHRLGVVRFFEGKGTERVHVRAWFDAEAGKLVKVLPWDTPSPEIDAIWEAELKAWSPVRHASGRKAWLVRRKGRTPKGVTGYAVEGSDGKITRHVIDGRVHAEFDWGWVVGGSKHNADIVTVAPFEETKVRVARPETKRKRYRYHSTQVAAAPTPRRILVNTGGRLFWIDMETAAATEMTIEGLRAFTSPHPGSDGRRRMRAKKDNRRVTVIFEASGEYSVVPYEHGHISGTGPRAGGGWMVLHDYRTKELFLLHETTGERKPLKDTEGLWPLESARDGWVLARQDWKRIVRYHLETGQIAPVWP
jgi:hypothetical protein